MDQEKPKPIYLADYKRPDYLIPEIELEFDIFEEVTRVRSRLKINRNTTPSPNLSPEGRGTSAQPSPLMGEGKGEGENPPLVLNGEKAKLISLKLDGVLLKQDQYSLTDKLLTLSSVPAEFTLEVETEIEPHKNEALEGLYKSGDIYCTQNEPEGFRHITYFLDRPDVMGRYTTTITADKKKYPILLSNGNPVEAKDLEGGRHLAKWKDPFPKPCYLFALVAGDVAVIEDTFTTKSGRTIALKIFVDKGNESRTEHAMQSLKKAMKWDEDTFGLECDLDQYMIVAVDAFNSGAMENKGLNIFNTQCILANPQTATDDDFEYIQAVIAHEYFHNWTGNRVTCRDWFQLTLKEGLTVFRDHEFTADMTSRAVKRISDVRQLRNFQFVEDSGPNTHPIRPVSYIAINNFYTPTVYEKGADVIRMIQTLIGKGTFRKGMDKYFELFDGQAVTADDFVKAMELASGRDLTQFKNWYNQAGTPLCKVVMKHDAVQRRVELTVEQTCRPTPEMKEKKPFYFPLSVGLIGKDGKDLSLELEGDPAGKVETTKTLTVSKPRETFVFKNISERPLPSLLRNFSAPVKLEYEYSPEELIFLFAHDSDAFNRYDAGQRLATLSLRQLIQNFQKKEPLHLDPKVLDAFGRLLVDTDRDPAFAAEALILPTVAALTEEMEVCDFEAAFEAREFLLKALAKSHEDSFFKVYMRYHSLGAYSVDTKIHGKRSLKNTALSYLSYLEEPKYASLAYDQFKKALNMTDEIAALATLVHQPVNERQEAIRGFYKKWQKDSVVINQRFAVQAGSKLPGALNEVKALEKDPAFDPKNPNKIRSLYGAFAGNLVRFHDVSGSGYSFISAKILTIDPFNASIAGRMATAFKKFGKLDPHRKPLMKKEMERILARPKISDQTYEIVSKTLSRDGS